MSLAEVALALTISATVIGVTLSAYRKVAEKSAENVCAANRELLNSKALLFYQREGRWPSSDLNELADEFTIPHCPIDETPYRFDQSTKSILKHDHN